MYAAKRGRAGGIYVFTPNMHLYPDEFRPRQQLAREVGGKDFDLPASPSRR